MTTTAGDLAGVVDALVAVPVDELCVSELQALIASVAPQVDRLAGLVSVAAGALQARTGGMVPAGDGGFRSVAGWLAQATRSTSVHAGGQLGVARRLRDLPMIAGAVLDGRLTPAQAAVLTRLVDRIPTPVLTDTQAELIEVAAGSGLDPHALGLWVANLIAHHCEPALEHDEATAANRRNVSTRRETDGRVTGRFSLTREGSEAFLTVLEALARSTGLADGRSAGQRRADALVEACEIALAHGTDTELGSCGGQRPNLSYVVPADWAARRAEQQSCSWCTRCPEHTPPGFADTVTAGLPGQPLTPGQVGVTSQPTGPDQPPGFGRPVVPAGHGCAVGAWSGPQTRARIEMLLCDARISRVLLDNLGQVHGLESLTDQVTRAQRRALAARDLGCATRGCTRPPAFTDAHHLVARADNGDTTLDNLVLLCRRHHVLWHLGKLHLHDLHVPWLTHRTGTDPPLE